MSEMGELAPLHVMGEKPIEIVASGKSAELLPEELRKPSRSKSTLYVIDCMISLLVITPLVVSSWRGFWVWMDVHVDYFPEYKTVVAWNVLHVLLLFIRPYMEACAVHNRQETKKHLASVILRRVHAYTFGLACIGQWRSGWVCLDTWLEVPVIADGRAVHPKSLTPTVITFFSCSIMLMLMKNYRNNLAVPFVIIVDNTRALFDIPTIFNTKMAEKPYFYILDCTFSVLIVGTLVVFVWRGAWVLLDIFLFPENDVYSAWASLVLGYALVLLAFALQPLMRWVCDRLEGTSRLLAADMFLVFALMGTINVWRGIWNLLNIYFLPDNIELSCWITHFASLVLLILLGCSNSLLVRGVYIDAEEPAGKCVVFPCYYLRVIFQQERAKKIAQRLQLDLMVRRKQDLDSTSVPINTNILNNTNEKYMANHTVC